MPDGTNHILLSKGYSYFGEGKLATTSFTSDDENEIKKIQGNIESDERILLVARQSRIRPGGSMITPCVIFATDRKLIIRNPMTLGLRETVGLIPYTEITSIQLKKGLFSSEVNISAPGVTTELSRFFKLSRQGVAGITAISGEDAGKLVEIVKQGMKRAKATPSAAMVPTPLEELKKLKELLDMGAVTKEEFEEKKKRLLEKV